MHKAMTSGFSLYPEVRRKVFREDGKTHQRGLSLDLPKQVEEVTLEEEMMKIKFELFVMEGGTE